MLLDLDPASVRADSYQVLEQRADGSLAWVEPTQPTTLRGRLLGFNGATLGTAAAAVEDDGLHATMRLLGGGTLWIEPLQHRVLGAQPTEHMVYRGDHVSSSKGVCAADLLPAIQWAPPPDGGFVPFGGGGPCLAQLACDADVEYFNDYGSVAAVESRTADRDYPRRGTAP